MPLAPPPKNFNAISLPTKQVRIDALRRITSFKSGEPYFGRRNVYRFDDIKKAYGTCYCGLDLTAVAETLLHDQLPENGVFDVACSQFTDKHIVRFTPAAVGGMLTLADLTGYSLKRLGGDNSISSEYPYDTPQLWSMAVHAHPNRVDGIVFVSRQLNTKKAVVVFDRAGAKLGTPTYTRLTSASGLARTKNKLGIRVAYP
ncbi:MAG: RES family NAD+ phosphorylase [Ramlibacter sp.]|nr:RES family NAD+ phosphorylase [Ramlibacter sp.]